MSRQQDDLSVHDINGNISSGICDTIDIDWDDDDDILFWPKIDIDINFRPENKLNIDLFSPDNEEFVMPKTKPKMVDTSTQTDNTGFVSFTKEDIEILQSMILQNENLSLYKFHK